MKSVLAIIMAVAIDLTLGAPGLYFTHLPSQPADTKVFRDALGNQHTSYAYQDGHSSAVAVSRSDSNTHLIYPPQVAYSPVVAAAPVAAVAPVAAPIPVAPAPVAIAPDYHYSYQPAAVSADYHYGLQPAPVAYDTDLHYQHDYYV